MESLEAGQSVEELLAEAQEARQWEPLDRLAQEIMRADYYLVEELTAEGAKNCYATFFDRFETSQFLTFNYDSLVAVFLLRRGLWYPDDGYGMPVLADRSETEAPPSESTSIVLHLHGSFCLYVSDHAFVDRTGEGTAWYEEVDPPRFIFDADSISSLFYPYRRVLPTFGYEPVERRVVAPVPDKTHGLRGRFVQRIYERAGEILESAELVVSIGCGFGPADKTSYAPLLEALQRANLPRLLIVDPAASTISDRLQPSLAKVEMSAVNLTFKQWVDRGCPTSSAG